eukprot:GHVU01055989.1.p1 GENE.GHVU01055989.1~~GHVU01055989.1.p1  ORF type:complete len:168 (+),score=8.42 GHVU01055989.1:54-557(+)
MVMKESRSFYLLAWASLMYAQAAHATRATIPVRPSSCYTPHVPVEKWGPSAIEEREQEEKQNAGLPSVWEGEPRSYLPDRLLPDTHDWRNVSGRNFVTQNVNQHIPAMCGACWCVRLSFRPCLRVCVCACVRLCVHACVSVRVGVCLRVCLPAWARVCGCFFESCAV